MKAPSKCPMCKEKIKWIMVDKAKHGNTGGAAVGAIAGSKFGITGAIVGGLIGNTIGKGKKLVCFAVETVDFHMNMNCNPEKGLINYYEMTFSIKSYYVYSDRSC